jgi:hypothetical protein
VKLSGFAQQEEGVKRWEGRKEGRRGRGMKESKSPKKGKLFFISFILLLLQSSLTRYIVFLGLHCFSLLQFPMSLATITL